ncbi:MAG TPA: TetR/AcrR family transcriptional regulator C-terminal domain-containing protein [Streptosporangiaceae bacterium]|nr:TetR/AcrR family transcriptional regulator C-terminal domain-containing protein [Streptosporangiaceae bacterium]
MQLTRRRIIDAAISMIERDGVDAISMDRLATELGCGMVSLYHNVPSKSALLDSVADAVLSDIEIPLAGAAGWQEQIRAQARAFRRVARAHPRCAMVVASRPASSAGVIRIVEQAVGTLCDAGFGGQDAVRIVRALAALSIGLILGESGIAPGLADAADAEPRRLRLRPSEFPHLTALAAEVRAHDPDADFECSLDMLVRGIAATQPVAAAR